MELRVWFVPSVTEREHDAIVKDPDAIPTIDADGSNITMYSVVNCSNFFKDNCATIDCIQGCDERSGKCADPNPQWWGIATTESMVPGTCECVDGFVGPSCSECDSFRFGKECHSLLLVIIPCSGGFLVILLVIFMVRYRRRLTEKVKRHAAKLKMIAMPNLPSGISSAQFIDKKQIVFGEKFASGVLVKYFGPRFLDIPFASRSSFHLSSMKTIFRNLCRKLPWP